MWGKEKVRSVRGMPLRWVIGILLFLSTVVNYLDRQTLSVLAPFIRDQQHWSNADFALVVIAFRAAYAIGQIGAARLLDRLGTRTGLTLTVAWYSVAAMLTSFAGGLRSFCGFRFLLGLGESANWPGATKAVAEWFPTRESGWAVALFDSGSSIGAALAPFIVLTAYRWFGSWRPVFVLTGLLGLLWLILFRALYRSPEQHPKITPEEKAIILAGRADAGEHAEEPAGYRRLLRLPETWGIMLGKMLSDPVWFFISDWFALYLVARGFRLQDTLLAFWIPFAAADLGNFVGGGVSSWLIRRGWPTLRARRFVAVVSGCGMMLLIPAVFAHSLWAMTACFAGATLSYASLSTMILNLPADLFPRSSVATVSGLSGAAAGVGTIAATYLTGRVADAHSFAPVLVAAGLIPLLAVAALVALVRRSRTAELSAA